MIGILDLEIGNLRSVTNAVYRLGFDPKLVSKPEELTDLTHLIIPGVGQFATAMRHAGERALVQPVKEFASAGRPTLGICLGMQLLATYGIEGGEVDGFDLIPGKVRRLSVEGGLRLPHVGWNRVILRHAHPVLEGLKPDRDFYFVHSYSFDCRDPEDALAETDYGARFVSVVARENVVGFQFHPEKSQANGLRLLERFCQWNGRP